MPIQDPLTQRIIGLCYCIENTLGHGEGTGSRELEVKDVE
jgi:hypothetical protein